jgi:hypothetical protein
MFKVSRPAATSKTRISIFFITYKNNFELNQTINSMDHRQIQKYNPEITVINNSPNFPVVFDRNYDFKIKILDNNTRADFSTGHLSRNWNQCLINGFENIQNPKNDIVVCCQNDVRFKSNFIDILVDNHNKFNFTTYGIGDSVHSYTIDVVKKVGLWDERFCNLGCHELDYWIRNLIFNKDKCSINDFSKLDNQIYYKIKNKIDSENNILNIDEMVSGFRRNCPHHKKSIQYHIISENLLYEKWQLSTDQKECYLQGKLIHLNDLYHKFIYRHFHEIIPDNYQPSIKQHIFYPYFEKDIPERLRIGYAN